MAINSSGVYYHRPPRAKEKPMYFVEQPSRKRSPLALALIGFAVSCIGIAAAPATGADAAGPAPLKVLKTFRVGGEGRWDYLCVDADARRLYVPRSTHVQ